MTTWTRSSRRGPTALMALVVLLLAVGCSSSSDDDASAARSTPTAPDTTVPIAPPSGSTPDTTTGTEPSGPTTTAGVRPGTPSSLPPDVSGPCRALAETYGVDDLQPRPTSSWVDERRRVLVDAQREATLLEAARTGVPPAIAGDLTTLVDYATFVAGAVGDAASFEAAEAALGAGPDRGAADAAQRRVSSWRSANC